MSLLPARFQDLGAVNFLGVTKPFEGTALAAHFLPGFTVEELLVFTGIVPRPGATLFVRINDHDLEPEDWDRVRPVGGDWVQAVYLPHAAPLAVAGPIVASTAATGVTSGISGAAIAAFIGKAIAAAAIGFLANFAISQLIGVPGQGDYDGEGFSDTPAVQDPSNDAGPRRPVPIIFGKVLTYPTRSVKPIHIGKENSRILRTVLTVGHAPLTISDIRLGETAISDAAKSMTVWVDGTEYTGSPVVANGVPAKFQEYPSLSTPTVVNQTFATDWNGGGNGNDVHEVVIGQGDSIQLSLRWPKGIIRLNEEGKDRFFGVKIDVQLTDDNTGISYALNTTAKQLKVKRGFALSKNIVHTTDGGGAPIAELNFQGRSQANRPMLIKIKPPAIAGANWKVRIRRLNRQGVIVRYFDPEEVRRIRRESGGDGVIGSEQIRIKNLERVQIRESLVAVRSQLGEDFNPGAVFKFEEAVNRDQFMKGDQHGSGNSTAFTSADLIWETARVDDTTRNSILHTQSVTLEVEVDESDLPPDGLRGLNCIAEGMWPKFDGATWGSPVVTRNPAWAMAAVLRGTHARNPIPDSRINGAQFLAFANFCEPTPGTYDHAYDRVIDFDTNRGQLLRDIGSVSFGIPRMLDGVWGVLIDGVRTAPVAKVTPRNMAGLLIQHRYDDLPHALTVKFFNETTWQIDQIDVFQDGYNADGTGGKLQATKFRTIEAPGLVRSDSVNKYGRYLLRAGVLRPTEYTWEMGWEYLAFQVGDMVLAAFDQLDWAQVAGRCVSVVDDGGGNALSFELDTKVEFVNGTSYAVIARKPDSNTYPNLAINNPAAPGVPVQTFSLTLTTPTPVATAPQVGDLVTFGNVTTLTKELVVTKIEPQDESTATVTAHDHAPTAYTVLGESDPGYTSPTAEPRPPRQASPPDPTIDDLVVIDRDPGAQLDAWGRITVLSGEPVPITTSITTFKGTAETQALEVQWKTGGDDALTDGWDSLPLVPSTGVSVLEFGPLNPEAPYSVRVRAISPYGVPSAWVESLDNYAVASIPNPFNLVVTPRTDVEFGALVDYLKLTWEMPLESNASRFVVRWADGGLQMQSQVIYGKKEIEVRVGRESTYRFDVQAAQSNGEVSGISTILYYFQRTVNAYPVNHLELADNPDSIEFASADVRLTWVCSCASNPDVADHSASGADVSSLPPTIKGFRIDVYAEDRTLLRTVPLIQETEYKYTFSENVEDGGPRDRLIFDVATVSVSGHTSAPRTIFVHNDPPALPVIKKTTIPPGQIAILFERGDSDPDFKGILVWAKQGATLADNELTPDNLVVDTTGLVASFDGFGGEQYAVRYAAFDSFTGPERTNADALRLNVSAVNLIVAGRVDPIDMPVNSITGFQVTKTENPGSLATLTTAYQRVDTVTTQPEFTTVVMLLLFAYNVRVNANEQIDFKIQWAESASPTPPAFDDAGWADLTVLGSWSDAASASSPRRHRGSYLAPFVNGAIDPVTKGSLHFQVLAKSPGGNVGAITDASIHFFDQRTT